MKDTYRKRFYPVSLAVLMFTALWQCNIEVGNPDSNLPESMTTIQNLSFNLSVGGACTTTTETCVSVPVVLDNKQSSDMTYDITAANFQLAGLQLKPYAESPVWTQLDLLHGSSVVLPESTDSAGVSAVALRLQGNNTTGARTFEIRGNLVIGSGKDQLVLPLRLEFDNPLLAEAALGTPGGILDGVEFNASVWFDFADTRVDFEHIFKGLTSGACRSADTAACAGYREAVARQVSRRISRSMTVKSHPTSKGNPQKLKVR